MSAAFKKKLLKIGHVYQYKMNVINEYEKQYYYMFYFYSSTGV
jgi:hypothetical protein